jgi:MFS-type transporter involved in bile tolerance (Atg22 family)
MLLGSIIVGTVFSKKDNVIKPLKSGAGLLLVNMLLFSALMFPYSISALGGGSIPYFVLLAAVLCLVSASLMLINIPVQTFIQQETPDEYMSRVFSLVSMISRGGMPFGALLFGVVLERIEAHWSVLAATLLMVVVSIVFLTTFSGNNQNQG